MTFLRWGRGTIKLEHMGATSWIVWLFLSTHSCTSIIFNQAKESYLNTIPSEASILQDQHLIRPPKQISNSHQGRFVRKYNVCNIGVLFLSNIEMVDHSWKRVKRVDTKVDTEFGQRAGNILVTGSKWWRMLQEQQDHPGRSLASASLLLVHSLIRGQRQWIPLHLQASVILYRLQKAKN